METKDHLDIVISDLNNLNYRIEAELNSIPKNNFVLTRLIKQRKKLVNKLAKLYINQQSFDDFLARI